MKQVYVDEHLAAVLDSLYVGEPETARRIDELLDVLEQDERDPRVRTREFRDEAGRTAGVRGPLHGFDVRGRDQDFLVLWEAGEDAHDVRYIGTALQR